jgi:hypothetical protein
MLIGAFDRVRRFVSIVGSMAAFIKVKSGNSVMFLLIYPNAKGTLGTLAEKDRTLLVRF